MKTLYFKRCTNILYTSLFAILCCTCSITYLPNQVNVPALTDTNDFSGSVSLGTPNMLNIQAAYSPLKNLGLIANYAYNNSSDEHEKDSYNLTEFGIGYYRPFEKKFLFDIYAGYGDGEITYMYTSSNDYPSINDYGKFSQIFIQPSVTFTASNAFNANLAFRPVLIFMNRTRNNETSQSSNIFIEPVLTLKYGWKYIKFITQFGLCLQTSKVSYEVSPYIISAGLNFELRSSWTKKEKKPE